jgi:hypothetical protein
MNVTKTLFPVAATAWLVVAAEVSAQDPGYVGEARPGVPAAIAPPRPFANSTDHYRYLLEQHDGGVTHTYDSVPKWEGIYSTAGNNYRTGDGTIFRTADGQIVEGLLTPEYEAAFRYRLSRAGDPNSDNGVTVDRLTNCEPAGHPRWLLEPYTREFVNAPHQSWFMNDLGNDTRRIYIGEDHQNLDGTHYPQGDSIGFWAEDDKLVVHTVDVWPNDFFRGSPPTSNQFESVEIFWEGTLPNGDKRIFVNATFYDELAFVKPITLTYTFRKRPELVEFGYRQRHFDCSGNDNQYLTTDENGNPTTQTRLPGEPGFSDPRGVDPNRNLDLPLDLEGQAKSPIFDDSLFQEALEGSRSETR